jgi:hypothetical protein
MLRKRFSTPGNAAIGQKDRFLMDADHPPWLSPMPPFSNPEKEFLVKKML